MYCYLKDLNTCFAADGFKIVRFYLLFGENSLAGETVRCLHGLKERNTPPYCHVVEIHLLIFYRLVLAFVFV